MEGTKGGRGEDGGNGCGIALPRPNKENKLCYTVPEAAQLLGFSRNFGYELARTGQIPIVRFGKRMLVPKAAFDKMLDVSEGNEAGK
jgi:excisionase family DNA binding protein